MKPTMKSLLAALTLGATVPTLLAQQTEKPRPMNPVIAGKLKSAEVYITAIGGQIDQYKVDLEKNRMYQLQAESRSDPTSAAQYTEQLRRITNAMALKQAELTMYQQIVTDAKQPRSPIPAVAALQDMIVDINAKKGQLNVQQLAATQMGNTREAARINAEIQLHQKQVQAKQQEIKLIELQAKTGRQ